MVYCVKTIHTRRCRHVSIKCTNHLVPFLQFVSVYQIERTIGTEVPYLTAPFFQKKSLWPLKKDDRPLWDAALNTTHEFGLKDGTDLKGSLTEHQFKQAISLHNSSLDVSRPQWWCISGATMEQKIVPPKTYHSPNIRIYGKNIEHFNSTNNSHFHYNIYLWSKFD